MGMFGGKKSAGAPSGDRGSDEVGMMQMLAGMLSEEVHCCNGTSGVPIRGLEGPLTGSNSIHILLAGDRGARIYEKLEQIGHSGEELKLGWETLCKRLSNSS